MQNAASEPLRLLKQHGWLSIDKALPTIAVHGASAWDLVLPVGQAVEFAIYMYYELQDSVKWPQEWDVGWSPSDLGVTIVVVWI